MNIKIFATNPETIARVREAPPAHARIAAGDPFGNTLLVGGMFESDVAALNALDLAIMIETRYSLNSAGA